MSAEWIEKYVDNGDFTGLFIEGLGWSKPRKPHGDIKVDADGESLAVSEVAHYKGIAVWACPVIPAGNIQRAVDTQLRKYSTERIVIFHDDDRQAWRWPQSRDASGAGSPRLVTHDHVVGRGNEALRQRLQLIKIGLDEDPSVVETTRRLRKAFDSDKVTKKFYRKFADEHAALIGVIEGIEVSDPVERPELRWYGSLLLNRLMFIYFMQRKGFLDNDPDYLRNRLERIRALDRPQTFYVFYRDFLLPLFHEGLGASKGHRDVKDPAIRELLGDVPYVNGGIFSRHVLEVANEIEVPDEAFERLFNFFDSWQWHLDDRPTGDPNEINPDVLGYIFEQFVNDRADKGAYYTKEDVTGYMVDQTLIPVFLERLIDRTGVNSWRLLAEDPDRYLSSSLLHGLEIGLPEAIEAEKSTWPRPAWDASNPSSDLALPGESWWEVVDRRKHAHRIRQAALTGEIQDIKSAIAANLDLEALATHTIDSLDNPKDVVAAWKVLSDLRIVDPTCGSGAFLFAALNVLHRLYEAVLDAVHAHLRTSRSKALATIAEEDARHVNRDYFILKHAALRNIYGVDIMAEAVEIARLRLFLKLIAQVQVKDEIEPLPDLEFNIRAGNALVGAQGISGIRDRVDLLNEEQVGAVLVGVEELAQDVSVFATLQESEDHLAAIEAKGKVLARAESLRSQLDVWWWQSEQSDTEFDDYLRSFEPLHWLVEFPEVMLRGGFDVVIGNPPYVTRTGIGYSIDDLETRDAPDIYAPCVERSVGLLVDKGRLAMITPHSLMQSRHHVRLRGHLANVTDQIFCSAFARIPAGLFENDVRVRNTIVLCRKSKSGSDSLMTSRCRRWYSEFRPHLMRTIRYAEIKVNGETWPFVDDECLLSAFQRLRDWTGAPLVVDFAKQDPTGGGRTLYWKSNAYNYLGVSLQPVPVLNSDGSNGETSEQKKTYFRSEQARDFAYVLLAGRVGLVWWATRSDDFHLTKAVLEAFPVSCDNSDESFRRLVTAWAPQVASAQAEAVVWKLNKGKRIGNWNLAACRHVTDLADTEILQAAGLTIHEMEAVWTAYERVHMDGAHGHSDE